MIPASRPLVALLALCAGASSVLAGPLTPPAGPVAPTYKTLTEVQPRIALSAQNTPGDADSIFRITTRGHYYLTANLIGAPGFNGIEIAASEVTIDLNGFEIAGFANSLDGIRTAFANLADIAVINGTIANWGDEGIDFANLASQGVTLRNLRVSANEGDGIQVADGAIIESCIALNNGNAGIRAGESATIARCSSVGNDDDGIRAGGGSVVRECAAASNGDHGISSGGGISVIDCTLTQNGASGIDMADAGMVVGCVSTANGFHGIETGNAASVTRCAVFSNAASGIVTGSGCTVSENVVRLSTLDGIQVASDCTVLANLASANGSGAGNGAGIHATGSRNRIEGNNCATADRGIDVDGAANLIIRNSCTSNTINWSIAAGNVTGLISDRTAPASPAVAGNSATTTLSFGDGVPNGNFSY